jgi:hypothetical protein
MQTEKLMSESKENNAAADGEERTIRVDTNSMDENRGPGSWADPGFDLTKIGEPLAMDERDLAKYDEICAGVTEALRPQDYIEAMLMLDVVDRQWELLLLRRRMTSVLARKSWAGNDISRERESAAPHPENANIASATSPPDAINDDIAQYERLLRMIDGVVQRRGNAIAEVDRYREMMKTYMQEGSKRMEQGTIDHPTYRKYAPLFRSP